MPAGKPRPGDCVVARPRSGKIILRSVNPDSGELVLDPAQWARRGRSRQSRAGQAPHEFLDLRVQGYWGAIDEEDARANEGAPRNGERLLSAYWTAKRERLWVITEADRSLTTILLPEECSFT